MPADNCPPSDALPLARALILHGRQLLDDPKANLLVMARAAPPDDRLAAHAELIRVERDHLTHALDTGFLDGGLFWNVRTRVQFEAPEFFNGEMIETFPLSKLPRPLLSSEGHLSRYDYMAMKVESGEEVMFQLAQIIDHFLLTKVIEGVSFIGRTEPDIFNGNWVPLPLPALYGQGTITIHWASGTLWIPGRMLYGVHVAPPVLSTEASTHGQLPIEPSAANQTIEGATTGKTPERRGRKAETAPAIKAIFSQLLDNPDELAHVSEMTQEMRRRFVGDKLSLEKLPSRSYVHEIWKKWLSEQSLSEITIQANSGNRGK